MKENVIYQLAVAIRHSDGSPAYPGEQLPTSHARKLAEILLRDIVRRLPPDGQLMHAHDFLEGYALGIGIDLDDQQAA